MNLSYLNQMPDKNRSLNETPCIISMHDKKSGKKEIFLSKEHCILSHNNNQRVCLVTEGSFRSFENLCYFLLSYMSRSHVFPNTTHTTIYKNEMDGSSNNTCRIIQQENISIVVLISDRETFNCKSTMNMSDWTQLIL